MAEYTFIVDGHAFGPFNHKYYVIYYSKIQIDSDPNGVNV